MFSNELKNPLVVLSISVQPTNVTITRKSTVQPIIDSMTICVDEKDYYGCIALFHKEILSKKTIFPILEYTTRQLFAAIPDCTQIAVCDKIDRLGEMGSSVVTGIALQMRLADHFDESISKSIEYIKNGNEWFHCDHISERVMGHALLTYPEKSIPLIRKLIIDDDKWIVRMAGVASHYAIKKGLPRVYVEQIFGLLLDNADESDYQAKRGLGWAAKTTAKFHPDMIEKHQERIENSDDVGQWFKTKLAIGLSSSKK